MIGRIQEVTLRTNGALQGHDNALSDRVNRRIDNLSEHPSHHSSEGESGVGSNGKREKNQKKNQCRLSKSIDLIIRLKIKRGLGTYLGMS